MVTHLLDYIYKYEQLIIEKETANETASKKIKQLESQLYSSQEVSLR